jgi:uncharacterized protein YyaL (SSP411 family)
LEQQPQERHAAAATASGIQWREWGEAAFRAAQQEGKPILLTLTAAWCHWCHVMDQISYSHPQVIQLVNSRFIPVRVDIDQRPDISRRYNQGGFPSIAFLDAQGQLITGRVYTPPEEMVQILEQVGTGLKPAPTGPVPTAPSAYNEAGPISEGSQDSPAARVLERLKELYDPDFGGFGLEPKQPPWEGLRLLLALYGRSRDRRLLKMVTTTLDSIRAGLYDQKDQGFFRYSVARDWKSPHYEKMLSTNTGLIGACLEGYQATRRKAYKDAASGSFNYLLNTLYDHQRGLFYSSQDAAEEYYRLPWKDRERAARPSIDRTFYTGLNAMAASSLVKAFAVLGNGLYLRTAARVMDTLWSECNRGDGGFLHIVGGASSLPGFLADYVHILRAWSALYQATGQAEHLERATEAAEKIKRLFRAPDGGFYDVTEGSAATDWSLPREKPVLENALLAEALAGLSCLTSDDAYLTLARETLETFQGIVPGSSYLGPAGSARVEEDEENLFLPAGSAWGRAWDIVEQGPVHMVLVGPLSRTETPQLLQAALKIYAPHQIVQILDPERDKDRIAYLGFPSKDQPALYACMGGICLAPIATPAEVRDLAATHPWSGTSR